MRLVVTAQDDDEALAFYRDTLGLPELASYAAAGSRVTILDAGRASLELTDPPHAAYIDEVEVGRRVAGHRSVRAPRPRSVRAPRRSGEFSACRAVAATTRGNMASRTPIPRIQSWGC